MKQYSISEINELRKLIYNELSHCLWGDEYDGVMDKWEVPIRIKVHAPFEKDTKVFSNIEYEFLGHLEHFTSQWNEPWDGFKEANPDWKPSFAVQSVAIKMAKSICETIEKESIQ